MPQEAEEAVEAVEDSEIEAAEEAVVVEEEDQEVSEEEVTRTDGLHSPSSVDS